MVSITEETQHNATTMGIPRRLDHPVHHDGIVLLLLLASFLIPVQHRFVTVLCSDGPQYHMDAYLLLEENDQISFSRHHTAMGHSSDNDHLFP